MKPLKLIIKNIGKIADETIEINKPLILFYGEIQQGKSTILNCVRWVFGDSFPEDIIRHGQKEGSIELLIEGGSVSRSFYWTKATDKNPSVVKARPVSFVLDGRPVPNPVAELKRFLNPFLLDQDFLRRKTEVQRRQYFAELFPADTKALDIEAYNASQEAEKLRAKISGYGDIDLTPVEVVDIESLKDSRAKIMSIYGSQKAELELRLSRLADDHEKACAEVDAKNDARRKANANAERAAERERTIKAEIKRHEDAIAALKNELSVLQVPATLALLERPAPPDRTEIQKELLRIVPDTSALDKQIQDAGATNVRAEQFQKNKARNEQKLADEARLRELEQRQKAIKLEKQAKLKELGDKCGVPGLAFDEDGNFIYQGTTAGMISDSQIMRLSTELSALYPKGFGLDLIDRAESLGKSIFGFVERATAEKKTILATIVGERPATVPENIGVFVVNDGHIE